MLKKLVKQARYLIEAFIAYLFYFIILLLPISFTSCVMGKIAEKIGPWFAANSYAKYAIRKCFPDLPPQEIESILQGMWNNLGRIIGEMPHWHLMSQEQFQQKVRVIDHSNGEYKLYDKLLMVSAHYGNWELFPRVFYELGVPIHLVYRPANNVYVDYLINFQRKKFCASLITKGLSGIRKIVQRLDSNENIGMLVDQKTNNGIDSSFLGFNAKATSAPATLSKKFNMPIFPIYILRTQGVNFEVHIFPPILPNDDSVEQITGKINAIIGEWVTAHKEQWMWVHKRWSKDFYQL